MDIEDLDIDVGKVEDKSDENDESGSEGDEPVEWTDRLHIIHVDNFTSPVGITFDLGNESREIDVFKMFFNDQIFNVIMVETNRYARQKQAGQALDK